MKKYSALVLFCFLFLMSCISSCHYKNEYQAINTNNQFSISIPSWMKEQKGLKEGAPFQYSNRFRNFYAIAETLPKADSANSVSSKMNFNLNVLRKAMGSPVVTDSLEINGEDIKGGTANGGIMNSQSFDEENFTIGNFQPTGESLSKVKRLLKAFSVIQNC